MLYYIPLEMYKERYTWQWSAPVTGWLERRWIGAGIKYKRIEGMRRDRGYIGKGVVLDAVSRSTFCFSQIEQLLELADQGILTNDDVLYFDDFWTPGLEALPYLFDQIDVRPKMYSFLFAQSVDKYDFTRKMIKWIRPIEEGYGSIYDGIFVTCQLLKDLVCEGQVAALEKVHVTGHPFCSEEVRERMPDPVTSKRENKVVYSSRWDKEKNPVFFLTVVKKVLSQRPDTKFVICTGSKELRSNDPRLLSALKDVLAVCSNLTVKTGCSKEDYYRELVTAKVQINTANQDFVPLTLLESSTAGCYPVYPYFRSFPRTFRYQSDYMYPYLESKGAAELVVSVLDRDDLWTEQALKEREWIHARFDTSWKRQLQIMGLLEGTPDEPEE